MKLRILAMPSICDVTDFGLSDETTNLSEAQRLLKKKVETIWETPSHEFFRTGDWPSGGYMVLYNKKRRQISYLVKFVVSHRCFNNFNKTVTQTAVWRSDTDPKAMGLVEKVFFEILLEHYGAVMSDSIQTPGGKRFWIQMMTKADDRGFGVAFVDFNRHQVNIKSDEEDIQPWILRWDTWQEHSKHRGERFLIFKK